MPVIMLIFYLIWDIFMSYDGTNFKYCQKKIQKFCLNSTIYSEYSFIEQYKAIQFCLKFLGQFVQPKGPFHRCFSW